MGLNEARRWKGTPGDGRKAAVSLLLAKLGDADEFGRPVEEHGVRKRPSARLAGSAGAVRTDEAGTLTCWYDNRSELVDKSTIQDQVARTSSRTRRRLDVDSHERRIRADAFRCAGPQVRDRCATVHVPSKQLPRARPQHHGTRLHCMFPSWRDGAWKGRPSEFVDTIQCAL